MIRSTMSDFPLTINTVLRHGRRVHAGSECVTFTGDGVRRSTYRQVADNADRLAAALRRLGIGPGDPDELPWDGESIGEIEVRGPWVTASYWGDPAPAKFHDGWLCTGDVGTITSGALELGVRRGDPQDLGRQVRQEGVAHAV